MSAAVLTTLVASASVAQSGWDRYQPGTLAALIRASDSTVRGALSDTSIRRSVGDGDKPSEHFVGYDSPTLATVIYTGESRLIDPIRRDLIARWGTSFRRDSTIVQDFHREYLFKEGEEGYWLPVQDAVASFFPKELRRGQRAHLYVMLLGGYYSHETITWAFIVNEFRAEPASESQ